MHSLNQFTSRFLPFVFLFFFFFPTQTQSDGYLAKFEQRFILAPLHNINRQNVKANKFILGRLGENQPYKYVWNTAIGKYLMYNTRKLTSFHKKKEMLHLIDLDLNPPFKHQG